MAAKKRPLVRTGWVMDEGLPEKRLVFESMRLGPQWCAISVCSSTIGALTV
jgi:hypothetical protein